MSHCWTDWLLRSGIKGNNTQKTDSIIPIIHLHKEDLKDLKFWKGEEDHDREQEWPFNLKSQGCSVAQAIGHMCQTQGPQSKSGPLQIWSWPTYQLRSSKYFSPSSCSCGLYSDKQTGTKKENRCWRQTISREVGDKYFFAECVFFATISAFKEYNLHRHFETTHQQRYGAMDREQRLQKVAKLKKACNYCKICFFEPKHKVMEL